MDFAILNCAKLYQIFRKSVIGDISVKTNNANYWSCFLTAQETSADEATAFGSCSCGCSCSCCCRRCGCWCSGCGCCLRVTPTKKTPTKEATSTWGRGVSRGCCSCGGRITLASEKSPAEQTLPTSRGC